MNLPDYNFLSAPFWLVTTLHMVTLTLHFLAMNFMVGGIAVILFGKLNNKWNDLTVQKFVKLFPTLMAATVTLGVAPLLFVQLVLAKPVYSASIVSAWFWLMIFVVAMIAYYFLYGAAFRQNGSNGRTATYLTIALIGFVYVSFIYSSVFSMAERPDLYQALYASNQSGLVLNPEIGSYIWRWLHMLVGAVTVGGFFVGLIGRESEPIYKLGKSFFIWGMAVAMVIGMVYLFTLGEVLLPYMRSSGIWWLIIAIVLSLLSLHFYMKKNFLVSGLMLLVSVLGMVINRHVLRLLVLDGAHDPAAIPFAPQWSIFIIFLVCFVIALALVWYMLKLFFTSKQTT